MSNARQRVERDRAGRREEVFGVRKAMPPRVTGLSTSMPPPLPVMTADVLGPLGACCVFQLASEPQMPLAEMVGSGMVR